MLGMREHHYRSYGHLKIYIMNNFMPGNSTIRWNEQILWKIQMTQTHSNNLNSIMSIKAIEFVVKNLPQCKLKVPEGFTGEFYHTFKEEILPTTQTISENRREGNTSRLISWGQHYLYTKTWWKHYK